VKLVAVDVEVVFVEFDVAFGDGACAFVDTVEVEEVVELVVDELVVVVEVLDVVVVVVVPSQYTAFLRPPPQSRAGVKRPSPAHAMLHSLSGAALYS
jgi:hypothetical protein